MNTFSPEPYDVAVVGAGPVGSLCALAHAKKGARVALLERNLKASSRLAGEWLHPPAVKILNELDIQLSSPERTTQGKGFVVFPEDGTEPMVLPYSGDSLGLTYEHSELVSDLHAAISRDATVDFFPSVRVLRVDEGGLEYTAQGEKKCLLANQIVGADGRSSVVRQSLGLESDRFTCSRMVGVLLEDTQLPFEGYGHVVLGGPGPILLFSLGPDRVRIIMDVPLDHWSPRDRLGMLVDSYMGHLPENIQPVFKQIVQKGEVQAAANELRPRVTYGNETRTLVGDAAGHYHPLTAVGMTLGFSDAVNLSTTTNFESYSKERSRAIRAPEFLALGLYEVFADHRPEAVALRQTIYKQWRSNSKLRNRTMALLACEDVSVVRLSLTFFRIVFETIFSTIPKAFRKKQESNGFQVIRNLTTRIRHFLRGALTLTNSALPVEVRDERARIHLAKAFLVSIQKAEETKKVPRDEPLDESQLFDSIDRATTNLLSRQREDGSWEGEMLWCPMLSAQYVLLHFVLDKPIDKERARLLLKQFEASQLADGTWGLHEHSQAYLFVTTLVYIAARILGCSQDHVLLTRAGSFIRQQDLTNIPSWGKFWLALLNLYSWRGLNAVLPELWRLPKWLPIHPSKWYCHTRMIYMAMSSLYAKKLQKSVNPLIESLRVELYETPFDQIRWSATRNRLRDADLFSRPTRRLRIGFSIAQIYERTHSRSLRERCVNEIANQIRWEFTHSSHTSISPVSGFLNILSLWTHSPNDSDVQQALAKLEDWIWEDELGGTRVTGARSASWDTGFALQCLDHLPKSPKVSEALQRGATFLQTQQILESFDEYAAAFRNDPLGGWCFAGVWHGWPVSDCTAEAVLGLLSSPNTQIDKSQFQYAMKFMLRAQGADGGFGSYEAKRTSFDLEWMNPAEMFGESMTENSYVECTASCLAAFASIRERYPEIINSEIESATQRAGQWIRNTQLSDGSWRGVWGVQYIYGTLFGIRGLLASGSEIGDPALRLGCRWLLDRQLPDGGWGEHPDSCMKGEYVQHHTSQVIQTAWSLMALLEAEESNSVAIERGVRFLLSKLRRDGSWPKQDMVGVFFRTALLDYELYRQYFPLQALAMFAKKHKQRMMASSQ